MPPPEFLYEYIIASANARRMIQIPNTSHSALCVAKRPSFVANVAHSSLTTFLSLSSQARAPLAPHTSPSPPSPLHSLRRLLVPHCPSVMVVP